MYAILKTLENIRMWVINCGDNSLNAPHSNYLRPLSSITLSLFSPRTERYKVSCLDQLCTSTSIHLRLPTASYSFWIVVFIAKSDDHHRFGMFVRYQTGIRLLATHLLGVVSPTKRGGDVVIGPKWRSFRFHWSFCSCLLDRDDGVLLLSFNSTPVACYQKTSLWSGLNHRRARDFNAIA